MTERKKPPPGLKPLGISEHIDQGTTPASIPTILHTLRLPLHRHHVRLGHAVRMEELQAERFPLPPGRARAWPPFEAEVASAEALGVRHEGVALLLEVLRFYQEGVGIHS